MEVVRRVANVSPTRREVPGDGRLISVCVDGHSGHPWFRVSYRREDHRYAAHLGQSYGNVLVRKSNQGEGRVRVLRLVERVFRTSHAVSQYRGQHVGES